MAVISLQFRSATLNRSVSVKVLLPSEALLGTEIPRPYKTLYFLHGIGSDAEETINYMNLPLLCEMKGLAIVIPNGENSMYVDHEDLCMNYSGFVGEELVNVTRKLFPLSEKREDTYIGGLSMGGFGSLMNGARFSETFSKAAVMSPATDIRALMRSGVHPLLSEAFFRYAFGSDEAYENSDADLHRTYIENQAGRDLPELFISCGTDDPLVYEMTRQFVSELNKAGVKNTYKEIPGGHDVFTWNALMNDLCDFLVQQQ